MAQNGGGKGWQWDEKTGEKTMPKKWKDLLDWLLQGPDRVPKFQKDSQILLMLIPDLVLLGPSLFVKY